MAVPELYEEGPEPCFSSNSLATVGYGPDPSSPASVTASASISVSSLSSAEAKPWHLLPDSLLFELFRFLDAASLSRAGLVCVNWLRVSRDDFLWKFLFCRRWNVDPRAVSVGGAALGDKTRSF